MVREVEDPRAWVQIANAVRDEIRTGKLRPGMRAPSITTLVQRFGVARNTAAKALRALGDEGLLVRFPGFGWYVR